MCDTPYLLLDEPSAALDQISIKYLLSLLDKYLVNKPSGQIIITCHEPTPLSNMVLSVCLYESPRY
jgi:ABC-2 type transport system ATP-binding protein